MKAKATVIQGAVRAVATTTGGLMAVAYTLPSGIESRAGLAADGLIAVAQTMPNGIESKAMQTDETGLLRFLQVTPEAPQELVWLVPQYGIDYSVVTSTGLNWKIQ